jgi:2-aminoethylphosphonate-pyruvate transaminase
MYTLWNLRKALNSDFLLLESDLLYDPTALQLLIDEPYKDVILSSGMTNSGDEVFIECSPEGFLVNMSKDTSKLNKIDSELVGISKVSLSTYQRMCSIAGEHFKNNMRTDYESVMVLTGKTHPFFVLVSPSLIWCEIDSPEHYRRAVNHIYPKLKKDFL